MTLPLRLCDRFAKSLHRFCVSTCIVPYYFGLGAAVLRLSGATQWGVAGSGHPSPTHRPPVAHRALGVRPGGCWVWGGVLSGAGGWHYGPAPRALTPDPRDSPEGSSGPAAALWQARLGTPGSSTKGPYRQEGKGPRRFGGAGSQAHTCPKASARFGTLLPAPLRSDGARGAVPLPVASSPARIPGSAMGCQAALLGHARVPRKVPMLRVPPVLHPLLHPRSGMCPVLWCGDFALLLQVPLPHGLDPAKAQPRRVLTEAARIWWYRRVRMHPAPAAWGELQAKAPQTPRHCPYRTLSPQRHFCCWFCTHISVTGTPGTSSSRSGCRDAANLCRQSCALLHAQCPAEHPRVPPASRNISWSSTFVCPPPSLL